jgi:hypothetical protein
MRAALSSEGFARNCFGLEASRHDIASNLSQTPPNPKASQSGVREAAVELQIPGASFSPHGEIN